MASKDNNTENFIRTMHICLCIYICYNLHTHVARAGLLFLARYQENTRKETQQKHSKRQIRPADVLESPAARAMWDQTAISIIKRPSGISTAIRD
jgi:hypothetical protein